MNILSVRQRFREEWARDHNYPERVDSELNTSDIHTKIVSEPILERHARRMGLISVKESFANVKETFEFLLRNLDKVVESQRHKKSLVPLHFSAQWDSPLASAPLPFNIKYD